METVPVIIYAKGNQIKALSVNDTLKLDADLKSKGLEKVSLLGVSAYIKNSIINLTDINNSIDCVKIVQEIESLSEKK